MPLRVNVHAAIWVDERLAVNRSRRHGQTRLTLPGGRVALREPVLDALRREVLEELGVEVEVGELVLAGEVFAGARRQDVVLVFEAWPVAPEAVAGLELIDPDSCGEEVLPPVLTELRVQRGAGARGVRWVGNIYRTAGLVP